MGRLHILQYLWYHGSVPFGFVGLLLLGVEVSLGDYAGIRYGDHQVPQHLYGGSHYCDDCQHCVVLGVDLGNGHKINHHEEGYGKKKAPVYSI